MIDDFFSIARSLGSPSFWESRPLPARPSIPHLHAMRAGQGLLGSPEKDLRDELHGKAAGAEINSSARAVARGHITVSAPAPKRLALSELTLEVSMLPATTDCLHSCLMGAWTSAAMYRRAVTACFIQHAYLGPLRRCPCLGELLWSFSSLLCLALLRPLMCLCLTSPGSCHGLVGVKGCICFRAALREPPMPGSPRGLSASCAGATRCMRSLVPLRPALRATRTSRTTLPRMCPALWRISLTSLSSRWGPSISLKEIARLGHPVGPHINESARPVSCGTG